ncbi:MAG: phosphoglycerate dehydrogenase [Bdellovibrionota bacterium]
MKIVVTSTSFAKNDTLRMEAAVAFKGHSLTFCDPRAELVDSELFEFIRGAEVVIAGKEKFDAELLSRLPEIKAICKYGVGIDNIDLLALEAQGVELFYEPGVNKEAVAEHTIGLMLAVLRRIAISSRLLHHGTWLKDGGVSLTGKTVAIIGCGACGGAVARLLRAFSCNLLLVDIVDIAEIASLTEGKITSLSYALRHADVVSLHVPLTSETKKMISFQEFSMMKPTAVLINTSRGEVVEENALISVLESRAIMGAGVDVFEKEPLTSKRLYSLENIVATPHIAGNSREAVLAMGRAAIRGVREFVLKNA